MPGLDPSSAYTPPSLRFSGSKRPPVRRSQFASTCDMTLLRREAMTAAKSELVRGAWFGRVKVHNHGRHCDGRLAKRR